MLRQSVPRLVPEAPKAIRRGAPASSYACPLGWNGVAHQVPSFDQMRPQKKPVARIDGMDERRNAPKVRLAVVTADGEHGRMARNHSPGAFDGFQFGAFDIHLNVRGSGVRQGAVQSDTLHFRIAFADG